MSWLYFVDGDVAAGGSDLFDDIEAAFFIHLYLFAYCDKVGKLWGALAVDGGSVLSIVPLGA